MVEGYIQEEIIDRIRNSIDIVEVLSDYLPLKKSGQNYKGLCPFHSEKTPSFIVSPSKQLYHCFGCGSGGDVFNFLVQYENLSFPETVRILAKKAGIKIEVKTRDPRLKTEKESLLKVNKTAEEYFHKILIGPQGKVTREYLFKRGIKDKTIEDFKLGFSLPAWGGLLTTMGERGYSPEILQKTGLIIPREDRKGYYDRFRGRIIFPIYNIEGDVIGFGGRVLDDTLPKYLNSPETLIYRKGENLYALNKAKDYIRKEPLILVEGYMDVIALHQAGITNTAATLGTALTKGHLKAITRFTKKVVIIFDADPAGKKAASMGLDIFIEGGIDVRIVSLPSGDDPDSFIMREGKDKFMNLLHGASNLIDFSLRQILDQDTGFSTFKNQELSEKISKVGEALVIISKIPNNIERGYYLKRLSEKTGIEETFLLEEFRRMKVQKRVHSPQSTVHSQRLRPKAEEILIHLMLKDKDIANEILNALNPEDITYPPFRTIAKAIETSLVKFKEIRPEKFINNEKDPEAFNLFSELSIKEMEYEDERKVMEDCLLHINNREKERRLSELQFKIKEAETKGTEEEVLTLLSEKQRLAKSGSMTLREVKMKG
jgi:DNA primase